ncbi:MAG: hypothetical protein JWM28_1945 [Chitinophagaceae bacterium]|nr:hypothetical protein [Chitinophagaceae bacterium]
MNPFFDIAATENLPDQSLALHSLGTQLPWVTIGRRSSDYWGTSGYSSKTTYRDTTAEDYDKQFINKLQKWKPVYNIDRLIEHHYHYHITKNKQGHSEFLKHMQYVILPVLKKRPNAEVVTELFEQWIDQKESKNKEQLKSHIVNNNTINVGHINAPAQFQQSSDHAIQTQHNLPQKEVVNEAFELLKKDLQKMDDQIRKDFAMEMDYAVAQLVKDKDIKPQLMNIGNLIKQVGIGMFSSLLAAPAYELIKPHLGLP